MKRFITCIAILLSVFVQIHAQRSTVCDHVSLRHALKGMKCKVITAGFTNKADCIELVHTREKIRIPQIEKLGKDIDSLDIIDYKNDTVYIYRKVCLLGFTETIELKSNKGAYRVYEGYEKTFEQLEIEANNEEEWNNDPNYCPSIYPDLFEWNGIEKLLKERGMAVGGEEFEELYRIIFKDYKLVHVDKWFFRPLGFQLKRIREMCERAGYKTRVPSEMTLVHVYDTKCKRNKKARKHTR